MDTNKSRKLEASPCPSCGLDLDGASCISEPGNPMPVENDLTMCVKCFTWSKYDKDLKLIPLTTEDKGRVDKKLWDEMEAITKKLKAASKTKLN